MSKTWDSKVVRWKQRGCQAGTEENRTINFEEDIMMSPAEAREMGPEEEMCDVHQQEYNRAKAQNNKSGSDPSNFQFFEEVDRVLGGRPLATVDQYGVNAGFDNDSVISALNYFGMDSAQDAPKTNQIPADLACANEKQAWLDEHLYNIIDKYIMNDNTDLTLASDVQRVSSQADIQTPTPLIRCRVPDCDHQPFRSGTQRKQHEKKEHNVNIWDNQGQKSRTKDKSSAVSDHIFNYHSAFLKVSLLERNFQDSIAEGDRKRTCRLWKFKMLHFRQAGQLKYSLEALKLQLDLQALLAPDVAHRLMCECTRWKRKCCSGLKLTEQTYTDTLDTDTKKQGPQRRPRTRQFPTAESEGEEESSDSEIGDTRMFFPFQTPEPNVNETYMLRNPPCAIRQSNEPDVSSAPVLSDSPASEPPAEDRDELSMQNLPEQVNSPERIHETDQTESDLPENVCPVEKKNLPDDNVIQPCDVHDEQLPVLPDVSRSEEEIYGAGSGESEGKRKDELDQMETESEEETERETGMDTSVRRSERTRQPPKRLDYAELGNPFVTVVKSFFHGLTTALADALSEEEKPLYPLTCPLR
ncbi:hypothetical protein ABVT39_013169 [Epinephelus coioides]